LTIAFSISAVSAAENATDSYNNDLNSHQSNTEYLDISTETTDSQQSINTKTSTTKDIAKTNTTQTKQASQTSSIYVSSNGNDKNNGQKNNPKATIKSALESVSNGGTIYLTSGTYKQYNIYIDKSVTIVGSGSKNTIVNAASNHAFTIAEGASVTFYTFSIKNAQDTYGGAIYNKGKLTLNGMRIYSCSASYGAAVYNKGVLTTYKTLLSNNNAKYGAGIYNLATYKASKTVFKSNTASQLGAAIVSSSKIDVDNSNFTQNKNTAVYLKSSNVHNYIRSCIFTSNSGVNGGAIFNEKSTLELNKDYFKSNTASNYGACLYNKGTVSIKSSSILSSNAKDGGAIYNKNYLSIMDSTINENKATNVGGAIYNTATLKVTNSKFLNNKATTGGVITSTANNNINTTITGCEFTKNTASNMASCIFANDKSRIIIQNSIFSYNNNRAVVLKNQNIVNYITNSTFQKNTAAIGSAVYNEKSIVKITKSTFASNNATTHGVIYTTSGKTNITYCILKDNNKIDVYDNGGTTLANYNWWCSNSNPSGSRAYHTTVSNWVIMTLDVNSVSVNQTSKTTVSFNQVSNGKTTTSFNANNIGKFNVALSINGCGVKKTYNGVTSNGAYSVSNKFTSMGSVSVTASSYNVKLKDTLYVKSKLINSKITSLFVQIGASVSSSTVKTWVNNGVTDVYVQTTASTGNTAKLKQVVSLCKNTNIRVHGWVICFYTGNGFDISSSRQTVVKNFISSVIRISGVDGICLDYVRYSGSNPSSVNANKVTNFVKQVKTLMNNYDSDLILSACVFAEGAGTKTYYGQDYAALSPYVDVMLPMAYKYDYNAGRSWLKSVTSYVVNHAKYSKVVTVLQTYKETSGGLIQLSKSELELDAQAVMSAGSYGYSLFRYGLISSYPRAATKL